MFATQASATAQTGGSISVSGNSGCLVSRQVPTTTQQDTFGLMASTACNGGSADARIRADASVPSIGLAANAISSGMNSSASAFVALSDVWTIGVAPGTPVGSSFTLPVSFRLEGNVSPGALYGDRFGRFIDVAGALGQFGTGSSVFQFNTSINGTGNFDQTFAGLATFTNYGPTVPTLAVLEISLSMPFLQFGAVDFYNTLSATVDVPQGFTVTSSSGTRLFAVTPVPEPETYLLFLLGLGALGAGRARRSLRSALTASLPSMASPISSSAAGRIRSRRPASSSA